MKISKSHIVVSTAGRDKGILFFVIREDQDYVTIANGKGRRVEQPKRKKRKHVMFVAESASWVADKLRKGEMVTNSELRKALSEFKDEISFEDQGGILRGER